MTLWGHYQKGQKSEKFLLRWWYCSKQKSVPNFLALKTGILDSNLERQSMVLMNLRAQFHIFFGAPLCSRAPLCGRVPKVVLPSAPDTRHLKKNLRMRSISARSWVDDLPSYPGVHICTCSG